MKSFFSGEICHHPPKETFDENGRRDIILRSRLAPLETESYGELKTGGYYHEMRDIEPFDIVDYVKIDWREMVRAIEEEMKICIDYRRHDIAALLQAKKERIEKEEKE